MGVTVKSLLTALATFAALLNLGSSRAFAAEAAPDFTVKLEMVMGNFCGFTRGPQPFHPAAKPDPPS
jgi:hypothetical protein